MDAYPPLSRGTRTLIVLATLVIIVAGMKAAASLVVPFLFAAFIAIICAPPIFFLERKGVPLILAVLVVASGIALVSLFIVALVSSSLQEFTSNLPQYHERLQSETSLLVRLGQKYDITSVEQIMTDFLNPQALLKQVAGTLSQLGGFVTNGFMIVLTVIFILLEASGMPAKLRAISADRGEEPLDFRLVGKNIKDYMVIKTITSGITGVCVALVLSVIGLDFVMLWALLAFILNYVPNIGSIIAAVPAVLLAFIQLGGGPTIAVAASYVVINTIIGSVIEPKIMGRGLGLSTLVVFTSLVFWGWVLGPMGMLLSVPLTMVLKIALESKEDTRWIATLLGGDVVEKDHPAKETVEQEKQTDPA